MKTVGLKTLKNKLSAYVRRAAAGETVVVTDRGRPVAEIVPPRPQPESVIERASAKAGSSYDGRLIEAARALGVPVAAL